MTGPIPLVDDDPNTSALKVEAGEARRHSPPAGTLTSTGRFSLHEAEPASGQMEAAHSADTLVASLAYERPKVEGKVPQFGILRALDDRGNVRPLSEVELEMIRLAIDHYHGQMSEVARRLGIGRSTLYRKLKEYGIDPASSRTDRLAC